MEFRRVLFRSHPRQLALRDRGGRPAGLRLPFRVIRAFPPSERHGKHMKQPDLILFAHEPRPGRVKTRLMPHRSPEQAAEIAAFMLRATVEHATSSWPGEIFLYCAPDTGHQ